MILLFYILLTVYSVRSSEHGDHQDAPAQKNLVNYTSLPCGRKPLQVYWNVPTHMCASKKVYFDDLYKNYGIIQNANHKSSYKGDKIALLYTDGAENGLFPAIVKNKTGETVYRNGGLPQNGNVILHLEKFAKDLDVKIPNKNFSGVGVIDFEVWRPNFNQLYGTQKPYINESLEIEKKLHCDWEDHMIKEEAQRRFEESARNFFEATLAVAKNLRPNARWGYYGYPYCFNMNSCKREECTAGTQAQNDETSWLWSASTALYPSVYSSSDLTSLQLGSLVRGAIREAARVAQNNAEILPYIQFRYRNTGFLSETDLATILYTIAQSDAKGMIIWGSSADLNTKDKCERVLKYVQDTFGPAIAQYAKPKKN